MERYESHGWSLYNGINQHNQPQAYIEDTNEAVCCECINGYTNIGAGLMCHQCAESLELTQQDLR